MGHERLNRRPVIVGAWPCGLFAAWQLTLAGTCAAYFRARKTGRRPQCGRSTLLENRVSCSRIPMYSLEKVAGTFSDGKLNTVVKDLSRKKPVMYWKHSAKFGHHRTFFMTQNHISNRYLGEGDQKYEGLPDQTRRGVSFSDLFKDIQIKENALHALVTEDDTVICRRGHSCTWTQCKGYLYDAAPAPASMEAKNFAVGFRVEHPQQMIDDAMYGNGRNALLGSRRTHKVTSNFPTKRTRGIFLLHVSGGYVVRFLHEGKNLRQMV